MGDQNQPHREVDLFRAIRIRDIEERDEMNGTSDPILEMYFRLSGKVPGLFDSWCPPKSSSPEV